MTTTPPLTERELRQSFVSGLDKEKAQLVVDVTKDPELREFARMARLVNEALGTRKKKTE
jgi:hypothetical protein